MRISDKYKVRRMAGQNVVIIQGKNGGDLTKIISLNDSALFLWNTFYDKEFTADDAKSALVAEYGIQEADASRDAEAWCTRLEECSLLAE